MIIKKIIKSSSNECKAFRAIFACALCDYEFEAWGYSDIHYFNKVLPNAICPKCGKNRYGETGEELKARFGRTYEI